MPKRFRRSDEDAYRSADRFLIALVGMWVAACGIAIAWFFVNR